MIASLLDTDLYKLTMMQVVYHAFKDVPVEYTFKCRSEGADLRPLADDIRGEIQELCEMRFRDDELDYLNSLRFIKPDFVEALRTFRLDPQCIKISTNGEFALTIEGSWYETILFEVPLLAIITGLMSQQGGGSLVEGRARLAAKVGRLKLYRPEGSPLLFSDFGTRRRYSFAWQEEVVTALQAIPGFTGTSNVHLAKQLGLTPIGTMAHEYLQAAQALSPDLATFQTFALNTWVNEYRGDLGIALSDVVGFEAFLREFDLYFAKLFDGCRHDSGDPNWWAEKLIAHYKSLGIDPTTKTAVFSDGLSVDKAIDLHQTFAGRIRMAFGIGTHFTNDLSVKAPQNVLKMTRCNGKPVAKISDSPGKGMCNDEEYLARLKSTFGLAD